MKNTPPVLALPFALVACAIMTCAASAAPLAATEFTGRTVSGKTASNIAWTTSGVADPGNLTWANEGGGPTNTGLFDTPDAQGHFAPDLNIGNEGPWSITIPLQPTVPELNLTAVVIHWRHFDNAGLFQSASRSANWTVSVTGSVSGAIGSVTASGVSGFSGVETLTFASPLVLSSAETYALKIRVVGSNTDGNNTALDALAIEGSIGSAPSVPFHLAIAPAPAGFHLSWPSRPGMNYRVRSSPDLSEPPSTWPEETANLIGTPPLNTEPVNPQGNRRFYVVEESPAEPLNVLLVIADDWRHDTLGSAGHPVVQTPSLDRLADEGVRFTQAAVTTSICFVSRASIFTGQWMSRHGQTTAEASIANWSASFPSLLRSSGYWVGHVGKWHNGSFPTADHDFGRTYYGKHWYSINGQQVHVTQRNENDALEFLRSRPANKPFLLTVATFAPHAEDTNSLQYLPQPETTSLYTNVNVPVPLNATAASFQRLPPFLATEQNEGRIRWRWRFDTPEKYQSMMKNYFRLCTGVDTMCGRILAELEQQGVLDKTLVIFIGDNGYFHAEHGLADKWYPFQESIRVPLIVRDPRLPAAARGRTHDAFALNVDLAPTILSAAGLAVPAAMQGRDLTPLYLATLQPAWREEFFYEHPTYSSTSRIPSSQVLVRRDWKYFYWPDFSTEQLFGLEADPIEENDRVGDPDQAARLLEMRALFNELKTAAQ
jgi:arylsulfatase A-like enzyme